MLLLVTLCPFNQTSHWKLTVTCTGMTMVIPPILMVKDMSLATETVVAIPQNYAMSTSTL